jgi:hypothetical protein
MFFVWNSIGTFFSILNIFNMTKNLIHICECILWLNIFPLISSVPQSDSGAESYVSLKLVGS